MFDIQACRGCLSSKGKLEKMTNLTKKMYAATTGLEINSTDGLPTYFCVECHTHIKKLLSFRRRCRRAFYVMKEIISVNKQLNLKHIMMVDRKRTNLESPYNFNKWQNSSYFTIDMVPPDLATLVATLDTDEPYETFVKHNIDSNSTVFHMDIEPTQIISIPEPVNTDVVDGDIDMPMEDMPMEFVDNPDTNTDDVPMDVFEDLLETPLDKSKHPSDSEDDFPPIDNDIKFKVDNIKKLKKTPKKQPLPKNMIDCCAILANTKIRLLSVEEQKEAFQLRLEDIKFKSAKYKCIMCVLVLSSMQDLLNHIELHKTRHSFKITCEICKLKFETEEQWTEHNSVTHLYEYKCKRCDSEPLYTLDDIVAHHKMKHPKREIRASKSKFIRIKQSFDLTPCTQEEIKLRRFLPISEHKCEVCGMLFVSQPKLQHHAAKHNLPTEVDMNSITQCDVCQVYFKSSYMVKYHMQAMHLYKYQCKKCPTLAYNLHEAEYHQSTHKPDTPQYLCEFCDKRLKTERELNCHRFASHYTETHTQHCALCGDSHASDEMLYRHQLTEHGSIHISDPASGDKEHYCGLCRFQFASLLAYRRHAVKHQHDDAQDFDNVCRPCELVFDTTEDLMDHIQNSCKTSKNSSKFNKFPAKCHYCDEIMESGKLYYWHHKRQHAPKPYRPAGESKLCEHCGQCVTWDFSDHMKRHTLPEDQVQVERVIDCVHCYPMRKFKGARKYASHMVRLHARRPYMCALCPATFIWYSECWDHIMKTHEPIRPYKCDICDKYFSHGQFLIEHTLHVHKKVIQVPRLDFSNTYKLWVYPDMKLNLSLLDESVLSEIVVELWDYMHEKKEVLDNFRDYVVLDQPDAHPRSTAYKKTKTAYKYKKKTRERHVSYFNINKKKKGKKRNHVKVTEVVECLDKMDIVEVDGEKFVKINGILYKIQGDTEETEHKEDNF